MFLGQTEIEQLRKTTKEEVISLLADQISPKSTTRSKLSIHIKSTYSGIKFDMSSAQPLVAGFMKHNIVVDQSAMGALMASAPDLQKVKDFAGAAIHGAVGLAEGAIKELREMVDGLKGKESGGTEESKKDGEGEIKMVDGTVWIKSQEEILRFKQGLRGSKAPSPVEPIEVGSARL